MTSNEEKPPVVRLGDLIRGENALKKVRAQIASAPSIHASIDKQLKVQADATASQRVAVESTQPPLNRAKGVKKFVRGDSVHDNVMGCNGIIVAASISTTEDGIPIHRIVDKRGNSWKQRQDKLK